jgi:hypothetical protein
LRSSTPFHCRQRRIAAHACAIGATVVTANADEFKRIRLKVENGFASRAPSR